MTFRTTAPDVEDALVARLQARAGLAGVLIQHGLPAKVPAAKERLYLVGVEDYLREQFVEQRARRETYVLPFVVEVHRIGGQNRSAARARSWEIIDELEQEILSDTEIGDRADDAEVESVPEHNLLPYQGGWIARALVHVRVVATIA